MTLHRESTGIAALDELGRQFEAATSRPRVRRRWPALALAVLALGATPAIAAVSGIFDGTERVEDALPQVAAVIDRADPTATGLALERLGFRVHWVLIADNPDRDGEHPTLSRSVPAPPVGTEILAILNEQGGNEATAETRDLMIEIAPIGSAILESHR